MAMRLLPAAAVLAGVLGVGAGCGLRSDPLDDFDGEVDLTEGPDPSDEGSCAMPKVIPAQFGSFSLTGSLAGTGSEQGQCGRDDGPEGVYAYTPAADIDVTIRAIPGPTTFVPTIRVERNVCGNPGQAAELCASDFIRDGAAGLDRHFLARAGSTYYITIDSPAGTRGNYQVELVEGPPPLAQCSVHAETIRYSPGGTFAWLNDFSEGYGRVSSRCGAPGKENMFRFIVDRPAWVFVQAIGSGGYRPVLSLRTGCSATSELECTQPGPTHVASEWFLDAGEYYLTVDNGGTAAGGYELFMDFG
jgi:hypothetical protein